MNKSYVQGSTIDIFKKYFLQRFLYSQFHFSAVIVFWVEQYTMNYLTRAIGE